MANDRPNPILRKLTPRNFLSFGPDFPGIELKSLNVLIGPNGCGKSNLIEAIAFLRAAPDDLWETVRDGGGVREWIWKGDRSGRASIRSAVLRCGDSRIEHELVFTVAPDGYSFLIRDERIDFWDDLPFDDSYLGSTIYELKSGKPPRLKGKSGWIVPKELDYERSILAQRVDPDSYPELTEIAANYSNFRIYRDWTMGRATSFRAPQDADMRADVLEYDFSNLGHYLNRLRVRYPASARKLVDRLRDLYGSLSDFSVDFTGGVVQVFFTEGNFSIPASRLSDGTLRYLCLQAILCDPEPPPLVCIEEPEIGLHPDLLPGLADALVELSQRTQVIVTTHSDILIDALSETPESVIVCEKHDGKTEMKRLSKEELKDWLKDYGLGRLWMKGQLGGNRW